MLEEVLEDVQADALGEGRLVQGWAITHGSEGMWNTSNPSVSAVAALTSTDRLTARVALFILWAPGMYRRGNADLSSRVGERGQVTIEKQIREELGVYAGDQAVQRIEDGRVVIEFVPGPHRRSLAGALRGKVSTLPTDERWAALRDAARLTPDPDRPA